MWLNVVDCVLRQPISKPFAIAFRLADAAEQQPVALALAVVGVGAVAVALALALHVGLAAALADALAALRLALALQFAFQQPLEQDAALGPVDVAVAQLALRFVAVARMGPAPPPVRLRFSNLV